eukprot:m.344084 g.344084  ORF g.344084 m.344084 type:complete len:454 (-) comp23824_c0_seq1:117-1478(-)
MVMALLLALCVTFALARQDSYPANSRICDVIWSGDKDRYDCRVTLSGGWGCPTTKLKDAKCRDINCADKDWARTVGMTCDGYPGYNGGWPMSKIVLKTEHEEYKCLEYYSSPKAYYCIRWEVEEQGTRTKGGADYEVGNFTCLERGEWYCKTWESEQLETKSCGSSCEAVPKFKHKECFCEDCDDDGPCTTIHSFPEQKVELTKAFCTEETEAGDAIVCSKWTQYEWDTKDGRSFNETEEYVCRKFGELEYSVKDAREIVIQTVCLEWDGVILSKDEFEVTHCERNISNPHHWQCHEKGHDMFFPNLGWAGIGLVGSFFLLFSIFICYDGLDCDCEEISKLVLLDCIALACFILCIWLGGVITLLIVVCTPLAIGLCALICEGSILKSIGNNCSAGFSHCSDMIVEKFSNICITETELGQEQFSQPKPIQRTQLASSPDMKTLGATGHRETEI